MEFDIYIPVPTECRFRNIGKHVLIDHEKMFDFRRADLPYDFTIPD